MGVFEDGEGGDGGAKGSIEAGNVADLCVLGADITQLDAREIPDVPVDLTVFGGGVVFACLDAVDEV